MVGDARIDENALKRFVKNDFAFSSFSKSLYNSLSHLFGHIAHYDRHGFYAQWFQNPQARLRWLTHIIVDSVNYDFPEERHIRAWLVEEKLLEKYQAIVLAEVEQRERADLARLQVKYGARP